MKLSANVIIFKNNKHYTRTVLYSYSLILECASRLENFINLQFSKPNHNSVVKALWHALRRRHTGKYGETSGNQYAARR